MITTEAIGLDALPAIPSGTDGAVTWVREHLGHLCRDDPAASPAFRGGQEAADSALSSLDISGYARSRSMVYPPSTRGASKLSPYIRHGLLPLQTVWDATENAPSYDRFRYQGELLWQEHARQWYAIYGGATRTPISHEPAHSTKPWPHPAWWREMRCVDATVAELERDGWCVNQTRMWLASQHCVRAGKDMRSGEDEMFAHLLDGSRAANRMGWQWVAGTSRPRSGGFARQQVKKRASRFCDTCTLADACPIAGYARTKKRATVALPDVIDPTRAFGPTTGPHSSAADAVWLTAESLGVTDPALTANPRLPAVFVFDEPLLSRLQLSGKRLVFLAETLGELSRRRELALYLGDPAKVLADTTVAVTFAPVPGFRRLASSSNFAVESYPWPWLRPPTDQLRDHVGSTNKYPTFKQWCRITKPESQETT